MASGTIKKMGLKKIRVVNEPIVGNGFVSTIFDDANYPNANFVGCICENPNITARIVRVGANTGYIVQFISYNGTLIADGTVVTYDVFYYDN